MRKPVSSTRNHRIHQSWEVSIVAHYCTYCEYIFKDGRKRCPFCARPIISDDKSDTELLDIGYDYAPHQHAQAETSQQAAEPSSPAPASRQSANDSYYQNLLNQINGTSADTGSPSLTGQPTKSNAARQHHAAAPTDTLSPRPAPTINAPHIDIPAPSLFDGGASHPAAVPEEIDAPATDTEDQNAEDELDRRIRAAQDERERIERRERRARRMQRIQSVFVQQTGAGRYFRNALIIVAICLFIWFCMPGILQAIVAFLLSILEILVVIVILAAIIGAIL